MHMDVDDSLSSFLWGSDRQKMRPHAPTTTPSCVSTDVDVSVPSPTIQNVVATVRMGELLGGLERVIRAFPLADYNSTRFAAAIIKLRDPSVTCSVFASGKAVITGAKGEVLARQAATQLVILLRRLGLTVEFTRFRVENVVSAAYCPFYIDLMALHERLDGASRYNPTVFPGTPAHPLARGRGPHSGACRSCVQVFSSQQGLCTVLRERQVRHQRRAMSLSGGVGVARLVQRAPRTLHVGYQVRRRPLYCADRHTTTLDARRASDGSRDR